MNRRRGRHVAETAAYVLFFNVLAYRIASFHFERLDGERRFELLVFGWDDLIFVPLFEILYLVSAALVATNIKVFHGEMPRISDDGDPRLNLWVFLAVTGLLAVAVVVMLDLLYAVFS